MLGMGIKLTADASGAQRAVAAFSKTAEKQVSGIGKELTNRIAGAFAAGAVVSAVTNFISNVRRSVDEIKDLSDQLGISTDEVQRLQKAVNDTGSSFKVITTALQGIEKLKADALSGDPKASGMFSALGIDPRLSPIDILKSAAAQYGPDPQKNAAIIDLIGRKAGILRNIVSEVNAQGGIKLISAEQIAELDKVQAALEESKRQFEAVSAGPMAQLIGFASRGIQAGNAFAKSIEAALSPDKKQREGAVGFLKEGFVRLVANSLMEGPRNKMLQAFGIEKAGAAKVEGLVPPAGGSGDTPPIQTVPATSAISLGSQGDALSRIGLFVGGRPEVGALRNIEANTRDTAQATRALLTAMRETRDAIQLANEGY